MLKVFGRKKSTPPQPDPPAPAPAPAPPARVVVSRPRQLGASAPEPPPPLYARFATRGESFDSSTASSLKANVNKTRPSLPEHMDSNDDLRAEYAKAVSSSRIYGNDSVTRFGSGAELPTPNSSKDEPTPVIVTKKRTPAPSRLGSNDSSSSAQPSQSAPSRSVSGPVATAPRLITRRQASSSNYQAQDDPTWDDELPPPRAPALYTRGGSSSTSTINSVTQSPISSYEDELSRSPPDLRSGFRERPVPAKSTSSVVVKKEKSLPVPPSSGGPTPTASRPVSMVSNTTTITPPVKAVPSAASLVHPAFKRSLPSTTATPPASALVHPSQRMRSASSQHTKDETTSTTTTVNLNADLTSSPQTIESASQLPIPSRPVVVKTRSASSSVPLPTPEPSRSTPSPPPAVVKTPVSKIRSSSPIQSIKSKLSVDQSSISSAARTPSPSPSSAPPSAHKDPILASVKRLSRRLSAEFGTYDIAAARKERERIINGSMPSQDRDLPPTPPSDSRVPSPTPKLKRASMVIATPAALTDVLKGFVKEGRDKREALSPKPLDDHKVVRSEKKRQSIAPQDLPTPPFSNDESSDGGKSDKGKGKEVVREPSVPASLERSDTAESGESRESRSRVTSAETIIPQPSRPSLVHQSTTDSRTSTALNMPQMASQTSSVASTNSSMFSSAMTENTKRTSVSTNANEPRHSSKPIESAYQHEDSAVPAGQVKRQSWYAAHAEEEMILAPVKIRKKRALPKPGEIVTSLDNGLTRGASSATSSSGLSAARSSTSRPLPSPLAPTSARSRNDSTGETVRQQPEPTRKVSRPLPSLPQNDNQRPETNGTRGAGPVSPQSPQAGPSKHDDASHRSKQSIGSIPSASSPSPEQPTYYPLDLHLLHPDLLPPLLSLLSFRDALPLLSVNMTLKRAMEETPEIREAVLERYLGESIGYRTWSAERMGKRKEPLSLTLRDLNSYMRGISLPLHHYSTVADHFLMALSASTSTSANAPRNPVPKHLTNQVRMMASSTRAYSKVVIRLRAQAEAEEAHMPPAPSLMLHDNGSRGRVGARGQHRMPPTGPGTCPPTSGPYQGHSRRSPSPAFSFTSYDRNGPTAYGPGPVFQPSGPAVSTAPGKFRSPLYRAGHAPLLRVFVPSPDGAWLSDQSVIECERELKRAGLIPLLKVGDVIHDLAAGDEANTGRLIWDGNYLIDLDYSYSPLGEIPKYVDSLAFPPSYFHKIIRSTGNPIVYLDLAPFAGDIATHLQLLQDRVQTETPQGGHHSVVRWIHRARFRIRPGAPVSYNAPPIVGPDGQSYIRLIDSGWHGIVVVDAEGTNEGLADLQGRIGNAVTLFAAKTLTGGRLSTESLRNRSHQQQISPPSSGGKSVFRLIRDKSRPGEIWLRCVREKERLQ